MAPQPPQRQRDSKRRRNALAPSPQALPRRREHTECRPNKGWLIRPATLFYGAGRRPAVGLWHLLGNHYPAIWSATTLQLAAAWRPRTVADEIRMIRPARWWKQDGGNHGDRDRRDVNHLGTPAGWTSPVHAWCRDKPVCCVKAKVLEILFLSAAIIFAEFFTNFDASFACTTRLSFPRSFSANTLPFFSEKSAACRTLKHLSSLFLRGVMAWRSFASFRLCQRGTGYSPKALAWPISPLLRLPREKLQGGRKRLRAGRHGINIGGVFRSLCPLLLPLSRRRNSCGDGQAALSSESFHELAAKYAFQ